MAMKIEGYFSNLKDAKATVAKLEEAGLTNSSVDMNEDAGYNNNGHMDRAGSEDALNLSSLVLASGNAVGGGDAGASPLLAASPMVSGMGGFEEVMDINCKVTVEAEGNEANTAKEIISSMGGTVENPNIETPDMRVD